MHKDVNKEMLLVIEKTLKADVLPAVDFPFNGPSW
jgi:hypothetical protein